MKQTLKREIKEQMIAGSSRAVGGVVGGMVGSLLTPEVVEAATDFIVSADDDDVEVLAAQTAEAAETLQDDSVKPEPYNNIETEIMDSPETQPQNQVVIVSVAETPQAADAVSVTVEAECHEDVPAVEDVIDTHSSSAAVADNIEQPGLDMPDYVNDANIDSFL